MKSRSPLVISVITSLILVALCFDSMAISAKVYLSGLAARADYVILGFVKKCTPVWKHTRDNSGKVISLDLEGSVYSISVKEVFFAKEPLWEREKEVYIFQKRISTESAILLPNKTYLLFLKKASMDPIFAKKYALPRDKYFTVVEGRQGQMDSSDLLYLETTRDFFRIKGIKNEKQRLKEWKKLLKSDNLEIRRAAKAELEKAGFKVETGGEREIR